MFVTLSIVCLSFSSVWGSNGGGYEKLVRLEE